MSLADTNPKLAKIYQDAQYDIKLTRTIEVSHPSFSQVWYLAQSNQEIIGKIENDSLVTYQPWGFELKLPDASSKGQSNAQFVIDASDFTILQEIWAFKNALNTDPSTPPIVLNWREYISGSEEIQSSILDIKLMDVEFNYNQIQGAGSRPDIINRPFPDARYDLTRYKGLKYV